MERGEIGWAGGEAGPHFFIYLGREPARHFGTSHTVWGEVADEMSLATVESIVHMPVRAGLKPGDMRMAAQNLKFGMEVHPPPGPGWGEDAAAALAPPVVAAAAVAGAGAPHGAVCVPLGWVICLLVVVVLVLFGVQSRRSSSRGAAGPHTSPRKNTR